MNIFPNLDVWLIAKFVSIIGMIIYLIFSLVVVRQVQLMTDTLQVPHERFVRILSFAHFLFAAGVLILAYLIL
jgi:hypothetical protein